MKSVEEIQRMLGEQLRLLRRKAKLSQRDVAEAMGISQRMVSKMERGQANFTLLQIWRFSRAVGGELRIQVKSGQSSVSEREFDELKDLYDAAPFDTRFAIRSLLKAGEAAARLGR